MSDTPTFSVFGVGLYTPEYPTQARWRNDEVSTELEAPSGVLLDRRSRRRASDLMKAMADAYKEALEQADTDASSTSAVFGSALGEAKTMIGLLDQMWNRHEPPSPMAFATSVHNAASGAVSIATENRSYTTSIAADFDTPAMSLVEAQGLLGIHDECVVVCGDEAAPEKLVREGFDWSSLTVALALRPYQPEDERALAHLSSPSLATPANRFMSERLSSYERLARNPQAGMLDLVDAILGRNDCSVRLDRGRGRGWTVQVTA